MDDEYTHPLLAQVPLTVSPFVSLPTATTLPYTYKSLPTSLPRSSTPTQASSTDASTKSKFIVSSSGHAAHPDDILASCRAVQAHLTQLHQDAAANLDKWERSIKERDLQEKRRLAPGWLDSEHKMLQPQRAATLQPQSNNPASAQSLLDQPSTQTAAKEDSSAGEELDRAFGGMALHGSGGTGNG